MKGFFQGFFFALSLAFFTVFLIGMLDIKLDLDLSLTLFGKFYLQFPEDKVVLWIILILSIIAGLSAFFIKHQKTTAFLKKYKWFTPVFVFLTYQGVVFAQAKYYGGKEFYYIYKGDITGLEKEISEKRFNDLHNCQMLLAAIKSDNEEMAEYLMFGIMDMDHARDKNGRTVLMISVLRNDRDLVKKVLKKGADINFKNPKTGETALFYSLYMTENEDEKIKMVRFLVENNANIHAQKKDGTRFMEAVEILGYEKIKAYLEIVK